MLLQLCPRIVSNLLVTNMATSRRQTPEGKGGELFPQAPASASCVLGLSVWGPRATLFPYALLYISRSQVAQDNTGPTPEGIAPPCILRLGLQLTEQSRRPRHLAQESTSLHPPG